MSAGAGPQRLGKYELREKLGHGGMAEVWKAFDTELHRYVAIKLLHANLQTDPNFKTRFSREARLIAALHHPNIVQIYDFQTTQSSQTQAPIAYMVMDYIEGETLDQYIQTTSRVGQFPAPTDIVHLFASISKALDYAHQEGIIHRDIKPANILLDKRHAAPDSIGEPVLTDFGIAKIMGVSSGTMVGMWLGTPVYVSPEQAQGHPGDQRSDVYSLGIVLYEICTGTCPFASGSVAAVLMQHINAVPTPPTLINPDIPPPLAAVILHAIAKNPAERFSSASALTAAIAEAFRLPLPAGLFPSARSSNALLESTHPSSNRPPSTPRRPQEVPWSRPSPVTHSRSKSPLIPRFQRVSKRNLIAWFAVSLVLISSIIVSLNTLNSGHASPAIGTLTFADSEQYSPDTALGNNDRVILSLHSLTAPRSGMAYFAWLMPDKGNDETIPLLLGRLSVSAGNATLHYSSPTHTNLLVDYSGVRITEQPTNNDPTAPPADSIWEGWLPNTPNSGDPHHYSLLSHLRHLLAQDPTLHANQIPGGLLTWMTRNVGKVEEWSSAMQGSWGPQMSDENADLIHRQLIRVLDYIDGQTYAQRDVPTGSDWLVDPMAGKLGLLSYTQNQQPPGYLQHVEIHLHGLADSPDHTEEQKQVAVQVDGVITRMINDLTQVRKDAVQLVQRSNGQLRLADTLTLLNEMASLTTEANSGWFDAQTSQNVGGAIWLNARIQQLAMISLMVSKQH